MKHIHIQTIEVSYKSTVVFTTVAPEENTDDVIDFITSGLESLGVFDGIDADKL